MLAREEPLPSAERLPRTFYEQPTLEVARALLGATLAHRTADGLAAGIIVETEAYDARVDPAAHGFRGMTPRTRTMFGEAGHAYVYRSYGMHYCLNVVTERAGVATAVLLRALQPVHGEDVMRARRGPAVAARDLARGPGRLCQALGITLAHDGADLVASDLTILAAADPPPPEAILATGRIGITRGVDLPWRFVLAGSAYLSRPVAKRAR